MQGIAQINLADYDGSSEMQLRWYAVQVFSSCGPPRATESERAGGAAGDPAQAAAAGKTVRVPASRAADTRCHGGFVSHERLCTLTVPQRAPKSQVQGKAWDGEGRFLYMYGRS